MCIEYLFDLLVPVRVNWKETSALKETNRPMYNSKIEKRVLLMSFD